MKKLILSIFALGCMVQADAQTKLEQDRQAIKALAGSYKVTFDYAETFAPDTAYKFHPRYHSWGNEWAVIAEETPKKIVIQHLLAVSDSMVIKHWREDWVYEEPTMLVYEKENTWKKVTLKPAQVKGRWVQKVYQVDDSPRYENIGTWTHVDGRHQWQGESDSPLPRREYTKRKDYNILRRGNRIYLTANGWMFEQDNKKILREGSTDKILAEEKGHEEFTKIDPKTFAYTQTWWKGQQSFWADIRAVWGDVFRANNTIKLPAKVNGRALYEQLFELGDQSAKEKWTAAKNKTEARKVIDNYLTAGLQTAAIK